MSTLRVLMQMRANALTQRGGDTVVMENIAAGLRALGHTIELDLSDEKNPRDYDLIHLYNFATPEITERQARRAVEASKPFIVTTMYEDWPFFFSPMVEQFLLLESYLEVEQMPGSWEQLKAAMEKIPPSVIQDNSFTAFHADALVGTGQTEINALRRDYPHAKLITDYRCGCEVHVPNPDPELFRKHTGLTDFILCVGRLEWRKNQLMLLKALEHDERPLVFCTGGFTYQPEYEKLCRKFRRRGQTIFLGKLEPELLASAYASCRAHVLPSWYELPGLVSIEAAHYGANIVVSDYGTIRDYLGDGAFYCTPDSPENILSGIDAAWNAPRTDLLKNRVKEFTWANATKRYMEIYEAVLTRHGYTKENVAMDKNDFSDIQRLDVAMQTIAGASAEVNRAKDSVSLIPVRVTNDSAASKNEAATLCDAADELVRAGDNDGAAQMFREASKVTPNYARPYRGLAVICLNKGQLADSEGFFRRALLVDKDDVKSELGIAMVRAQSGRKEQAMECYAAILQRHPTELLPLKQYLQLAYELREYSGLESVLRNYLAVDGTNVDIRFCLAGCLFKQGRDGDTRMEVEAILRARPDYAAAGDLLAELDKRRAAGPRPVAAVQTLGGTPISAPVQAPVAATSPVPAADRNIDDLSAVDVLIKDKKFEQAEARAIELLETSRFSEAERARLEVAKAEAMICVGRGSDAREILERHRDDINVGYRATASLGVYWGSENNWERAAQLFRISIALNPSHDIALSGLGVAALLKSNKEEAWEFFSRAHAANPENIRALTGLIETGYPLKRLDALEHALLTYLEYVPGNLSILYAHAGCAYALGKFDVSVSQLQKIRIFDPSHALANELLAKIEEESRGWNQVRA